MYLTLKSGIAKPNRLCYNTHHTGMWLSWLARFAHIEEVGGSSPSIPTMKKASFVYQGKRGFFLLSEQKTGKIQHYRASEWSIGFSGARFFAFSGNIEGKTLVSFLRFFAAAKNA